ncbi:DUF485 domain-containing protein [Lignipirellula cremea]|uniref:Inner membrane protein YjcH n=1 Tax=Lignipirellula cremea TaxID=2528010 RepID=A0A518E1T6_9BACT|nr:DUF485 domain-containing protein [Lignipirellula cremea]QDU98033.1 hypothetical protein Pla8534_58940 [Lignipirellula cremea]
MNTFNARLGLLLFFIYLALYSGFVGLAVFAPGILATTPWAGVNLAILYGFALIIAAFALAILYGLTCRDENSSKGGEA